MTTLTRIIAGERTGPVTGPPPAVGSDSKNAILNAAENDPTGQSAPGKDGGDKEAPKKEKTEKECTDVSAFVRRIHTHTRAPG